MLNLHRITAAFALPLAMSVSAGAQQTVRHTITHTITHEDLFGMRRVGAPALSPDGKWTVFSVTEPSYVTAEQVSDLWIVPTDGSASPRRLTNTKGGEGGVAWSPDGRRIAFSAQRDGDEVSQIYVLSVNEPGEAQRVTSLSTGASSPIWRPDGRALLVSSMIFLGARTDSANRAAASDLKNRKWNARVFESSPIRLWDHWLDDRRASLFIQPLDQPATPARDILAGTKIVAIPGFRGQLGNSGEDLPAAWTPDGSGIVFAATTTLNEWTYANPVSALWLVSANGGEPRQISPAGSDYGSPRFSRDGRTLYATMTPENGAVFNNTRLVMWSWPLAGSLAGTVVAGGPDLSVGSWAQSGDGRTIYFLAESEGHGKLFHAPSAGGASREVGTLSSGNYSGLQAEAGVIAAGWESAVNPVDVGRVDPSTGKWIALSRFNADRVAKLNWEPLREFWFTNAQGRKIHSFIALPPNFDSTKKYPLFVLIHGGAANMWTDNISYRWNYHLLGSPGYVMLMTDYRGSTGYGERFSQDIKLDPLEGPANDLNAAADEAIRRFPFIDASRQVAGGASYGGHLTNWLAVTTTRYRALVSHAGEWDLETQWATSDSNYGREVTNGGKPPWENGAVWRDQSPMRRAANLYTPVLVSVGERDFRVPMNNALEFWTALQRQKVPSKLIVWPTENHWILNPENSRFFYRTVREWMERWLNNPRPPKA